MGTMLPICPVHACTLCGIGCSSGDSQRLIICNGCRACSVKCPAPGMQHIFGHGLLYIQNTTAGTFTLTCSPSKELRNPRHCGNDSQSTAASLHVTSLPEVRGAQPLQQRKVALRVVLRVRLRSLRLVLLPHGVLAAVAGHDRLNGVPVELRVPCNTCRYSDIHAVQQNYIRRWSTDPPVTS